MAFRVDIERDPQYRALSPGFGYDLRILQFEAVHLSQLPDGLLPSLTDHNLFESALNRRL